MPDLTRYVRPGGYLDEILGVAAPDLPEDVPDQGFQTTGWQRFLEGFDGTDLPRPRNFGQGFAAGLLGQLSNQGSKIAARRAKFEAQQDVSRAKKDEQRRKSSEDYRQERAAALRDLSKSQSAERTKAADYERDNPVLTQEMIESAPEGSPIKRLKPGTRLTQAQFAGALMKGAGEGEPLIAIQTPQGPRLVTRAEAYGKEPGKNAASSELTPQQAGLLWGLVSQGGAFPPLGRGGITSPGAQAILNAGLNQPTAPGATPQTPAQIGTGLAGSRAIQQGQTAALRNIETSLAQQTVFTKKLKKNTDRLRAASKKIVDLGPRFVNGPVRYAIGQLGSADQAAFNAAMLPVATESARLLTSGPALGGQLTDSAQKELRTIVSGDFNLKSLNAVLDILENDAQNGLDSYTQQRDELRRGVGGRPGSAESRSRPPLSSFAH